jgi:hypothetical protein
MLSNYVGNAGTLTREVGRTYWKKFDNFVFRCNSLTVEQAIVKNLNINYSTIQT